MMLYGVMLKMSGIDNLVKEMMKNITKIEHNSLCETKTYTLINKNIRRSVYK